MIKYFDLQFRSSHKHIYKYKGQESLELFQLRFSSKRLEYLRTNNAESKKGVASRDEFPTLAEYQNFETVSQHQNLFTTNPAIDHPYTLNQPARCSPHGSSPVPSGIPPKSQEKWPPSPT